MDRGAVFLLLSCLTIHTLAYPYDWTGAKEIYTPSRWIPSEHQGRAAPRLKRDIDAQSFHGFISFFEQDERGEITVVCDACKAAIETIKEFFNEGYTEEELLDVLFTICSDFEIMSEPICRGFAANLGPEIVTILNRTTLAPIEVCSFLLGNACGDVNIPGFQWNVSLPEEPKPPVERPEFPSDDVAKLRVLHIADTHIDLHYEEGSLADCDDPLCCRAQSGPPTEGSTLAGRWGGWKCDVPMVTFENMLDQIANTHKDIDYIIWTGDLPAHDLWDQTRDTTVEIIRLTGAKLREFFPNTPIYPAIGNHDAAPVNSFPGPNIGGNWNISWLYDVISEEWGNDFLNANDNTNTIRRGAFYSTLVRPGLRLVSMNMNYCYLENWWLVLDSEDQNKELDWLANELQNAEHSNEKVHIIGHIPPGHSDCFKTWSTEYVRIIGRYENVVAAQFFGHTHKDEFEVYYDLEEPSRPIASSFIGPSVTTYTNLNPGYRIYSVDGAREGATGLVLDHETWVFDLEEANAKGEPEWRLSYKLRDAYGLSSLLPEDFHEFYKRLSTDSELMDLYYKYYTKESSVRGSCDESCATSRLCAIRSCNLYPPLSK